MEMTGAQALSEEARYRLLVESITDYAIYMLDPKGIVASWNAGAERIKGYKSEEIIGRQFSVFYTPEDRAVGKPDHALQTAASEGRFEAEGWRLRKDGTRFWTHVIIDPIRDPSGSIMGFAKITRDLTERKLAEAALKSSEQQFRLLVQGVTDYAIYMLDRDGKVASWNPGAQRIKGYTPNEIIGEHFGRFYQEEDCASGEPQRCLRIAREAGRFETEAWRVRKDGTRFRAHVVIDRITDQLGTIIGFAKVTRDITERDQTQHLLEEAREALFQAQKLEAIGQLTGGVAHDFNNLLAVVIGSLELLRKRLPPDQQAGSLLDNAMHAAQRGASLTQRMLAFARRQDLQMTPVDVGRLINGMIDMLQRTLGPSVIIETEIPQALPNVRTDANQLETALLNLAVNARDAMPEGGSLTISVREEGSPADNHSDTGRFLCLSVADEGEGMDAETVAKAVEPFFTTKGVGKGTGLGLSMVQGFAEQSGGRLTLTSRRDEGTLVEIWLPVADEQTDLEATSALPFDDRTGPGALRVLAVDDDALVLMNTTAMLEDLGHVVTEAFSGDAALELMREGQEFDLVITDHAMPKMTGMELAEALRAHWPRLPIVVATGYAELPQGNVLNLPKLSKPFDQAQLEEAVVTAVSMHRSM
ncbi:MAG: PAS domain S-box protein [Rhizobiaceae bacterium]|nr:PAS domain S-box protein [Rhizobiaceae bacterium]